MLDRRTILTGLAALPAAGLPVVAQPDPTFALIERHRAAYAVFTAALKTSDADDELTAETAALDAMIEREPTTLAGLRAFADYIDAHTRKTQDHEAAQGALATLAGACRLLIPAPIGGAS